MIGGAAFAQVVDLVQPACAVVLVLPVDQGFAAVLALHPVAGQAACGVVVATCLQGALCAGDFLAQTVALQFCNALAVVVQCCELAGLVELIGNGFAIGQDAADTVAQCIVFVVDLGLVLLFCQQVAVGAVFEGEGAGAIDGTG